MARAAIEKLFERISHKKFRNVGELIVVFRMALKRNAVSILKTGKFYCNNSE